ncbi:MAG: gliding motility-associated C-terminal domain-containing protein [Saprospiraceae bacterium]
MSKSILGLIVAFFFALQSRAAQPIFNIGSLTDVTQGQIINIDFHVDHFSQLVAVQFSVNWNPQVLGFRAVKNLNPSVSGLNASNFNTTPSFTNQGKFTLAWIEPGVNQITIPDGSLFFTVEFEVLGTPCQSSVVAITDDPTEIQASEDGINDIGLVAHNGQVSVFGEGCSQDLTLIGNSVIGACGSTSCIQFTVDNFITVGAMEFSLVYDPAVLQFNRFQNFGPLPAFGEGNTNLLSPGTLRVVWFNGNAQNDTLPNGTTLFEICFDVIGTGGQSSDITLGTNPPVMISDIDGNLHNVVIQPAVITAQCALQGFALIADTVCTTTNGITCIDVSVNDFEDIVAVQLSMNWDSTKFIFDHLEGFGLPGLDASGFGTPPSVHQGQLTLSWIDLTLNGVTVPDFSTIFRLCLKAIGPVGTSSVVSFSDTPLEIEIANKFDSVLVLTTLPGLAQIKTTCDTDVCAISYTITPTSPACPRESTGSVDLNVTLSSACSGTPSFVWSLGNLPTEDLSGVPTGTYTVTITLGSQVVIANTTVTDPLPIGVTGTITDPNPPGSCTGAIDITVTGGTPPYTFKWNTTPMVTTEDLVAICPGSYIVTVTDSKGCTFIPDAYIVGADVSANLTNVTCNGGSNGAINLSVSFGTAPYTFIWNPGGATTQNLSNLTAGTYCVTITDSASSTRDTCFIITQPLPLVKTATITNDLNEDCHGAIDLNVTGGTPPYTYHWNTGEATQDLINLCPGLYCVTITYNSICSMDTCFTITAGGIGVNLSAQQYGGGFETSCHSACDGSITSAVTGGASPYTYLWNNGFTTANLSSLCEGTYTLTVTDASGQTATSTIVLTSPDTLVVSLLTTLPSDPSASDGAVSAVVTGGVPNYTYQWSPVGGNSASLNNLPEAIYFITVTDANQCKVTGLADLTIGGNCFAGLRIITPNDDGKNDYFIIKCIYSVANHLSIYNRFGGLVYETDNYQNNWNGVDVDNQPIADGGYLWVLQTRPQNGPAVIYKGTVNVLRTAD